MIFSELGRQAIRRADFWFVIIAISVRNWILCVPPTEGGILEAGIDLGQVIGLGWWRH